MPSKDAVRMNMAFKPYQAERLDQVCEQHKITRNGFVTAMVSVLSDGEVAAILQRYQEVKALEKELRRHADSELLKYIKGKSPSELRSMLEAAKAAS